MDELVASIHSLQSYARKRTRAIVENLGKNHLWQRQLKNIVATTILGKAVMSNMPSIFPSAYEASYSEHLFSPEDRCSPWSSGIFRGYNHCICPSGSKIWPVGRGFDPCSCWYFPWSGLVALRPVLEFSRRQRQFSSSVLHQRRLLGLCSILPWIYPIKYTKTLRFCPTAHHCIYRHVDFNRVCRDYGFCYPDIVSDTRRCWGDPDCQPDYIP